MAVKVKSVEQFCSVYSGFIAHEETKRGLGKTFHEAVIMLLNENPSATKDELVELFRETTTEVENTLMAELKAAFGEDATPADLSDWRQAKSDYKRALELVDRRDLMKCTGWHQVRTKKSEVLAAMKEKEEGGASSDGNPAGNSGGDSGYKVPEGVQALVNEAMKALSQMSEEDATRIARGFKDKAWANMRNAKKKPMATGVNGSADKANAA